MAYQDQFYTVGTVTVANGSTAVTGAGTGWETALIVGGVFYAGGGAYPIQSVASETELTLAIPYIGVDATGVDYAIDRQRAAAISNIAMNDRLAQIIREISIGNIEVINNLENVDNLASLAEIALLANKLLGTDATKSLVQIDLGTLGKALLSLATGTNAQYVQGDGTLQEKSGLPVSAATQTALDGKASLSGSNVFNGNQRFNFRPQVRAGTWPNTSQMLVFGYNNSDQYHWSMEIEASAKLIFARFDAGNGAYLGTPFEILSTGVNINGTISKGGGTFLIDHPIDPFNRNLRHGFVEAPRYDLIYRGTVQLENGRATVDIDAASNMTSGTFAALTTNAVVTSLQNQDGFAQLKPGPINGGTFEIICEDETCTDLVSWVVIAERNDPFVKSSLDPNTDSDGRFVPEFEKEDA
ncbi:hypothetical protein [Brucella intermedia]|uniref:hypothetical protein n=1 Tax=Brucella intermedia TaxID=94625 RepID=UPI000469F459|nr:hypothetical protein [Brucella intermedia]